MDTFDKPDLAGLQRQNYRRCSFAFAEETNVLQQCSLTYARGCEDQLLAGSQIFGFVDPVLVLDPHLSDAFFQFGLVDDQASLHVAVETTNGGCGDDTLGRSARSHNHVNAGSDDGGCNAGRKIPIADEFYARARLADVGDESFVTRTVEHHDHQIVHAAMHAASDVSQVIGDWGIELDCILARRPDDNFLHVAVRRMQEATFFGRGKDSD